MATLSRESEALLTEFSRTSGASADQVSNLRNTINASPALLEEVNAAVKAGHLKHFAALPAGTHAGGSYDGGAKTMNLPLAILSTPAGGKFNAMETTFVLGHELRHGFNNADTTRAYAAFGTAVETVAKSKGPVHDYTAATSALIQANRRDEASAEIGGWNAMVGNVRSANPKAGLSDIYEAHPGRMADFIDRSGLNPNYTYALKPNLSIRPDLSMEASAANVAGMGANYFDKAPAVAGLGFRGNSDYANYYGAYATTVAVQTERSLGPQPPAAPARMTFDMNRLHLSESLLEQNGIDLGRGAARQPYYDSSTTPPQLRHFDQTATTHQYKPIEESRRTAATGEGSAGSAFDPLSRHHPDHALYRQIRDGVQRVDEANGRAPDAASERIAASLLPLAKANGLTRVDHVVLGRQGAEAKASENVFIVQGELNDPAQLRAHMKTETAARNPVADSFRQAEAIGAAHQQQPEPQPAQIQDRAPPPDQLQAETQKPQVMGR